METIRGKQTSFIDVAALAARLDGCTHLYIDIGTGDGRFVLDMASRYPDRFVIGLDACRENLQAASRTAPANTLFVIANAQELPPELNGLAHHVTVNFPWGSLLGGLLMPDSVVVNSLRGVMHPGSTLEILLNAGALAEAGWSLEEGVEQVRAVLNCGGFRTGAPKQLPAQALRNYPTTWAKRLAFGRDPRAVRLSGKAI